MEKFSFDGRTLPQNPESWTKVKLQQDPFELIWNAVRFDLWLNWPLIVDESQNLTPHEIKTIVTRAGDGTKIVLTGDSFQIDNPYVDSANNGLVYLVDRFKDESIAAHITLSKGERSKLSELASNLL